MWTGEALGDLTRGARVNFGAENNSFGEGNAMRLE